MICLEHAGVAGRGWATKSGGRARSGVEHGWVVESIRGAFGAWREGEGRERTHGGDEGVPVAKYYV